MSHQGKPLPIIRAACAIGLAVGLIEALVFAIRRSGGEALFQDSRTIWTAPVADLALVAISAVLVSFGTRRWRRAISERAILFVPLFFAFMSLVVAVDFISFKAGIILAAGLAWQASRILATRLVAVARWPLVILTITTTLILVGHEISGRRDVPLPPTAAAQPTDSPNVLLIVLDTVRASQLSLHGYRRDTTPDLAKFAARGVVFNRAFSTSSWTLPSHGSMFTGRFANELSADWLRPLDDAYPTLAEHLHAHGYSTAGFVANVAYASREFGLSRGFSHYEDRILSVPTILTGSALIRRLATDPRIRAAIGYHELIDRKPAPDLNASILEWFQTRRARRDPRPYFVFANYYDAHDPYVPPEPFATRFSAVRPRGLLAAGDTSAQPDVQELETAYDSALSYLDHHLAALLSELAQRGELDRTLVVITSDHGEEFGEHRLLGHGSSLFLESLHVPLVISFPGRVPAGVRVDRAVSLRDIPATIVDLLDVGQSPFPGRSMAQEWQSSPQLEDRMVRADVGLGISLPDWYPVMRGPLSSLIAEGHQYIRNRRGEELLFDLRSPSAPVSADSSSATHERLLEFRRVLQAQDAEASRPGLSVSR